MSVSCSMVEPPRRLVGSVLMPVRQRAGVTSQIQTWPKPWQTSFLARWWPVTERVQVNTNL